MLAALQAIMQAGAVRLVIVPAMCLDRRPGPGLTALTMTVTRFSRNLSVEVPCCFLLVASLVSRNL